MDYMDYFEIRYKIITQGCVEKLKSHLENDTINIWNIEDYLGASVYHNQVSMIALLNNHIRERNLCLNKINVLKGIYNAKCRHTYSKRPGICISFMSFEDYYKDHKMEEYENIFETFKINAKN
jgi:hypothetical protein